MFARSLQRESGLPAGWRWAAGCEQESGHRVRAGKRLLRRPWTFPPACPKSAATLLSRYPQSSPSTPSKYISQHIIENLKRAFPGGWPVQHKHDRPRHACPGAKSDFLIRTCVKGGPMDAIGLKYDWWRKCKDREYWKTSVELLLKRT